MDDDKWKRRFWLFTAVRMFGLITFLAGVAIMFGDFIRPGGWPAVGGVLILVGLADAIVAPMILKRHWAREDAES